MVVFAIMLWQNVQMRTQLRLIQGAVRVGDRSGSLSRGDQLKISVQGEGTSATFDMQAARAHSFWWLFDPDCPHCRDSAKVLARLGSERQGDATRVAALTFADSAAASRFMDENNLSMPVYKAEAITKPSQLHATPQFFQVDPCGTVIEVFSTDVDFLSAVARR